MYPIQFVSIYKLVYFSSMIRRYSNGWVAIFEIRGLNSAATSAEAVAISKFLAYEDVSRDGGVATIQAHDMLNVRFVA